MEIEVSDLDSGVRRVSLAGRLDTEGVGKVETPFTTATATSGVPCVIDLGKVAFLASMGIRMLVSCAKTARSHGGRLVLCRPQPLVEQSLRDTGLDLVFPIVKDETEAIGLLKAG